MKVMHREVSITAGCRGSVKASHYKYLIIRSLYCVTVPVASCPRTDMSLCYNTLK